MALFNFTLKALNFMKNLVSFCSPHRYYLFILDFVLRHVRYLDQNVRILQCRGKVLEYLENFS